MLNATKSAVLKFYADFVTTAPKNIRIALYIFLCQIGEFDTIYVHAQYK